MFYGKHKVVVLRNKYGEDSYKPLEGFGIVIVSTGQRNTLYQQGRYSEDTN